MEGYSTNLKFLKNLPCLGKRTNARRLVLKPFNGKCYRANSLYLKSLLLNSWSTNNSSSKSNKSCRQIYPVNRLKKKKKKKKKYIYIYIYKYPVKNVIEVKSD